MPNDNLAPDNLPARTPDVSDSASVIILSDEQMRALGVLHEDINDLFRLTRRSATFIIMHALKINPADAARIMEYWWHDCRKKHKPFSK